MTDVFFSYSSRDRERVAPFKASLERLRFSVFWDLETPAGKDWNSWIRENLARSRTVVVFWSANSLASDPVKTEADEAKRTNKLIAVRLDGAIDTTKLPLGHDRLQMPYVGAWAGDSDDPVWTALVKQIEERATPPWVNHKLAAKDAQILSLTHQSEKNGASVNALTKQVENDAKKLAGHAVEMDGMKKSLINLENQLKVTMRYLKDTEYEMTARTAEYEKRIQYGKEKFVSQTVEIHDAMRALHHSEQRRAEETQHLKMNKHEMYLMTRAIDELRDKNKMLESKLAEAHSVTKTASSSQVTNTLADLAGRWVTRK